MIFYNLINKLDKNNKINYHVLYYLGIVIILVLCWFPEPENTEIKVKLLPHTDKIVHFTMFFVLGLIGNLKNRKKTGLTFFYVSITLLAIITEFVQEMFIPSRTGDFFDLIADIIGIITSAIFYKFNLSKIIRNNTQN